MTITFTNFGGFRREFSTELQSKTQRNGTGKTTLLNGYLFALTGKTLNGFEPRHVNAPDDEPTSVTLTDFAGLPEIRRTLSAKGGTTLYLSGDTLTQTEFKQVCASRGIDIDFAATCVDANALTSESLTSEDLRKLLTRTEVMDNEEATILRKELKDVRAKKRDAETYALSNVVIPKRTKPKPSKAELDYCKRFNAAKRTVDAGLLPTCKECGQRFSEDTLQRKRAAFNVAQEIVETGEAEYKRIEDAYDEYAAESAEIEAAQRMIQNAEKARTDLVRLNERIEGIEAALREVDAESVRTELPEGVTLVTEQTGKNGAVKSVCTLFYNGVALKSVNHAKRVEICVRILDRARENKGMQHIPIIIDNAESVQGLGDIENLVRLCVG